MSNYSKTLDLQKGENNDTKKRDKKKEKFDLSCVDMRNKIDTEISWNSTTNRSLTLNKWTLDNLFLQASFCFFKIQIYCPSLSTQFQIQK